MAVQKAQPDDLISVINNRKHYIKVGNVFLKTPMGNLIEAPSSSLCDRIKADFENQGDIVIDNGIVKEPLVLSAYVLASTAQDFMEGNSDSFSRDFLGYLHDDPVFSPTAGHPIVSMYQVAQQGVVATFLQENGLDLKVLKQYNEEELEKLLTLFLKVLDGFSPFQKSALVNMSWPHGGQFVATSMYLLGRITSKEWAQLIFSRTPEVCRIVGEEPIGWMSSITSDASEEDQEQIIDSLIEDYEIECRIAERFFEAMR